MKNFFNTIAGQPADSWMSLPFFIRAFCYYFMLSGVVVLIIAISQLFGVKATISIYGLESKSLLTITGVVTIIVYAFKFLVAWGFYKGMEWAKTLAHIDAVIGILICIFMIFGLIYFDQPIFPRKISFDLFFLIPYLIILKQNSRKGNAIVIS